jgi:hypothetical protein
VSFLDDVWTTFNWLAITIPFFVAYGTYEFGERKRLPAAVSYAFAACAFLSLYVGYYFAYPVLGFPAWMRWFQ